MKSSSIERVVNWIWDRYGLNDLFEKDDLAQEFHCRLLEKYGANYQSLIRMGRISEPDLWKMGRAASSKLRNTFDRRQQRGLPTVKVRPDLEEIPVVLDVDLHIDFVGLLDGLSPRDREIVEAKRFGYSYLEIADQADVSMSTVKRVLLNFRELMTRALEI